ncbi:MAG: hypothetical protein WKF76_01000 [Nocardioidaceae bacterium]
MKRLSSLVTVAVMSIATLTACSGGDGSEYCDRFRANAESNKFDNLGANDIGKVTDELKKFRDLAPDELKDDYDTLIAAIEKPSAGSDPTKAVKNIADYAVENCDVKPSTGS